MADNLGQALRALLTDASAHLDPAATWKPARPGETPGQLAPGEADNPPDIDITIVHKTSTVVPISTELAMEYGLIPDTRPPSPPPTWRTRLRWRISAWRELAALRLYRLIAGHDVVAPWDD